MKSIPEFPQAIKNSRTEFHTRGILKNKISNSFDDFQN